MEILDVHTHNRESTNSIINIDLDNPDIREGRWYSVGVHPWDSADAGKCRRFLDTVKEFASHPQVLAIGEVGLDRLRGADIEAQQRLLSQQVELAEAVGKPLILHVVKAYPEIIAMKKSSGSSVDWIIHGFRGKPELAQELLRHGFYISLGEKYNEEAAAVIPSSRLLVETDMSDVDIHELASRHPQLDYGLADKIFKVG